MKDKKLVGEVHDVSLTLFRDVFTAPVKEWTNNQCFQLTFDSPYIDPSIYEPFDPASPPECSVSVLLPLQNLNFNGSAFNFEFYC